MDWAQIVAPVTVTGLAVFLVKEYLTRHIAYKFDSKSHRRSKLEQISEEMKKLILEEEASVSEDKKFKNDDAKRTAEAKELLLELSEYPPSRIAPADLQKTILDTLTNLEAEPPSLIKARTPVFKERVVSFSFLASDAVNLLVGYRQFRLLVLLAMERKLYHPRSDLFGGSMTWMSRDFSKQPTLFEEGLNSTKDTPAITGRYLAWHHIIRTELQDSINKLY